MVVFTCNHCGESLQKPRVEKHYSFSCRKFKSLTCVDCFKDFKGEEYTVHTKCVTEEERYSAKGSLPNGVIKKGELKQESWMDMIRSIMNNEHNLKPACRNLLNTISNHSNIPRKKPKFINFMKSLTGGRVNISDIESVWNIIDKHKQQTNVGTNGNTPAEQNNVKRKTEGETTYKDADAMEKRIKLSEENVVTSIAKTVDKFNIKETILAILNKKNKISLLKLEKKICRAYLKQTEDEKCPENFSKRIHKKLKRIPNLQIAEDSVQLLDS